MRVHRPKTFDLFALPVELQCAIIEQLSTILASTQTHGHPFPPSGLGSLRACCRFLDDLVSPTLFKNLYLNSDILPQVSPRDGEEILLESMIDSGLPLNHLSHTRDVYILLDFSFMQECFLQSSWQTFECWIQCLSIIFRRLSLNSKINRVHCHFLRSGVGLWRSLGNHGLEQLAPKLCSVLEILPSYRFLELNLDLGETTDLTSWNREMMNRTLTSLGQNPTLISNLTTLVFTQPFNDFVSIKSAGLFSNLNSLTLYFTYLTSSNDVGGVNLQEQSIDFPNLRCLALIPMVNTFVTTGTLLPLLQGCAPTLRTFFCLTTILCDGFKNQFNALQFPQLTVLELSLSLVKDDFWEILDNLGQWKVERLLVGNKMELNQPFEKEEFRTTKMGRVRNILLETISKGVQEGKWKALKKIVL